MNYACIRIFGLGYLVMSSVLLVASQVPVDYKAFIAGLLDLTEDNYSYCMRAVKRDIRYCTVQEDTTHCYPLEIIFKCYPKVASDMKERYKKLFEQLLKSGAVCEADLGNRVTEREQLVAQELGAIGVQFDKIRAHFPNAFQAVQDKDIRALDALLKDHPLLVKMVDLGSKTTLLHVAAQQFSCQDAPSVQMFAYLMRKGADF